MASDPVVKALADRMADAIRDGGGWEWDDVAYAVLADADLRKAIGEWEPPPTTAERLAQVLWPHAVLIVDVAVEVAQRAIDAGYHLPGECPPKDDQ